MHNPWTNREDCIGPLVAGNPSRLSVSYRRVYAYTMDACLSKDVAMDMDKARPNRGLCKIVARSTAAVDCAHIRRSNR